MADDGFQEWYEKSLLRRRRQSSAMKGVSEKKRWELVARAVAELETDFPDSPPSDTDAIAHWLSLERNNGWKDYDYPDPDADTLRRWKENLLRHRHSNYDRVCDRLAGEIGREAAYEALRREIDRRVREYLKNGG